MSFANALRTSQLPEKPWQAGAVARFAASVVISWVALGGLGAIVVQYFETPQHSSAIVFITFAVLALASIIGALVMLVRPWTNEERYLINLIVLLGCIYAAITFIWLAQRLIPGKIELQNSFVSMLVGLTSFQAFALIRATFFLREHSTNWSEAFGLKKRPFQALSFGIAMGILAFYPIVGLNQISFQIFEKLTLHPHEQQAVEILRHTNGLLDRVVSGIGTILIAPFGEEIIFRGVFYPWAKRSFSQPAALWGTAILFGVIHANLSSLIPLTLLAVLLVWLYEYTGNLLAPIAMHSIFNGVSFILLFYQEK